MSFVRSRAVVGVLFSLVSVVVAWALVAVPAAPAADAPALLPGQTLYLTERFSETTGPGRAPVGDTFPEQLLALQGEREGFQFVVNNNSGAPRNLAARVVPDSALSLEQARDSIAWELLRVGFVDVPKASTRVESSRVPGAYTAGSYADPLPSFRNETAAGRLTIGAGNWGGIAAIARIRTDATAGLYSGSVELYDPTANDLVYARQPFTLNVRPKVLTQGTKASFKTVMSVEADAYWLQNSAMRNGPRDYPTYADRMLQLQGLMSFFDSRGVTIAEQSFANPGKSGRYTCSYTSHKVGVPSYSFLDQVKNRYFGVRSEINPGAQQFATRMFPVQTGNCDPQAVKDDYLAKIDKYNTPTTKQDDVLDPGAASYWRTVASEWANHGLFSGNVYAKNPFDEPSDQGKNPEQTKRFRAQYANDVPKANSLLHAALGSRGKVMLADWPRDDRGMKVCRKFGSGQRCTNLSGDTFSNRKMWDGKGTDDVDVWVGPFSRLFGRPVPDNVRKDYKVNRDRLYADRLAKLKKLRGGREVWAYNFFTGNALMPQLTIDAPLTDARMNYWVLAREGHTGLYVSNSMLGWGSTDEKNNDGTKRKGDPWAGATYFKHPTYGSAAGWGTFIYPGYRPELGMGTEADRNTAASRPVSSLRMEGMRDGQEDANLLLMYRAAFGTAGQSKVDAITKPIFPGTYGLLPSRLGQVTFPKYSNDASLAQRLERQRRAIILALAP